MFTNKTNNCLLVMFALSSQVQPWRPIISECDGVAVETATVCFRWCCSAIPVAVTPEIREHKVIIKGYD
jgi:hypothetical protein